MSVHGTAEVISQNLSLAPILTIVFCLKMYYSLGQKERDRMKTQVNASVRLPSALHARIISLAEFRDRSPHSLMLQAIETFVSREEQREALRQEAKAAHEHYMLTGLHLTNAEVIEWMDKIIQGEKAPMPKCHI